MTVYPPLLARQSQPARRRDLDSIARPLLAAKLREPSSHFRRVDGVFDGDDLRDHLGELTVRESMRLDLAAAERWKVSVNIGRQTGEPPFGLVDRLGCGCSSEVVGGVVLRRRFFGRNGVVIVNVGGIGQRTSRESRLDGVLQLGDFPVVSIEPVRGPDAMHFPAAPLQDHLAQSVAIPGIAG